MQQRSRDVFADSVTNSLEILKMIEWTPVVFGTFKAIVLGTGMFFAIKWHYDKGKKENGKRATLRSGAKVAAVFLVSLLALALFTYVLVRMLHLNLSYP